MEKSLPRSSNRVLLATAVLISIPVTVWFQLVQNVVPEIYLDEVFHVRQAQNYVQGNWHVWDPKITTPPGLYIVSYFQLKLFQALRFLSDNSGPQDLRSVNLVAVATLVCVIARLLLLINKDSLRDKSKGSSKKWSSEIALVHHTVNSCLFPPLFFFYSLYYTDVLSALSVLFAYQCFLEKRNEGIMVTVGLVSLLFRQTNIFWVAFFLGGFTFCRPVSKERDVFRFDKQPTLYHIVQSSWQYGAAYDPLISEASFEDYLKSGVSYAIAGTANLPTILPQLAPYLLILSSFLAFVFWNGGVVLGDKENHIPSLHLAQMLYIWPYLTFFSLPLLYPYLIALIIPSSLLPPRLRPSTTTSSPIPIKLPRSIIAIPTLAVMLAVVHYNTLIHPFTLADNRHYTFYVFRLLLRHPSIKYLVVPIYFLCACACVAALSPPTVLQPRRKPSARALEKRAEYKTPLARSHQRGSTDNGERIGENRVSFLLIYLLATSASLITAPLVEPRYLIVPWLIWRLHIPVSHTSQRNAPMFFQVVDLKSLWYNTIETSDMKVIRDGNERSYDHRLWLETAWFLVINIAVGYMFLYKGFEWPQEPGTVQRFMW